MIAAVPLSGSSVTQRNFHVGASGDDASKESLGVRAEIRTQIYDAPAFNYFYVAIDLSNGTSVNFGYILYPGAWCLRGTTTGDNFACLGPSETIGVEARWEFQYISNWNENYYLIGPRGSAGANGTWHQYSIIPSSDRAWSFALDGREVANIPYAVTKSMDPVRVAAEAVTTLGAPNRLGPVEFRNLSYLKEDGWHEVTSLTAHIWCSTSSNSYGSCDEGLPYGVSVMGPNYVAMGSGMETRTDGDMLWTNDPWYYVRQVGYVLAIVAIALVSGYFAVRRRMITLPGWKAR